MNNSHCLEIEFVNVDFNKYIYQERQTEISNIYHAHLYIEKDLIELRILFDEKIDFGYVFSKWLSKINWQKFGSFLKIELTNNHTNEKLQKVDLADAKLLEFKDSSDFYEQGKKYISVKIDVVKFYWNPVELQKNTAEFYFDDKGFRVVEPFYSILLDIDSPINNNYFNISRMNNSTIFYKLENSEFRPEFNLIAGDERKSRVATIKKEPKIQFKYNGEMNEEKAVLYNNVVLMLASFYYHIKIDYVLSRIHLPENTITIKKLEEKNFVDRGGNLWGFEIYWDFNKFLQSSWQKDTLKNYDLLSKAIKLFNQSHIVDDYSTFLIRYNIIEICDKQKSDNVKFTHIMDKKQTKAKQDEALKILLETIKADEHDDFKKRWQDVQANLQNKPMKNQLVSFLESQNLDIETFPIKIKDLKELRNKITHGSINEVDTEQLRQVNILLYRISGILILNLMGIKDWKLNTKIRE